MASEIYYRPVHARCEDGRIRSVWVKRYRFDGSMAADNAFAVPAYTHAFGKSVRGFVTRGSDGYRFLAYTYCKNFAVIKVSSS